MIPQSLSDEIDKTNLAILEHCDAYGYDDDLQEELDKLIDAYAKVKALDDGSYNQAVEDALTDTEEAIQKEIIRVILQAQSESKRKRSPAKRQSKK